MRGRIVVGVLVLARFAPAQTPHCVAVEGDRIAARDFAATLPQFGQIPGDTPVATSPVPGARRIFHPFEITALGKNHSLAVDSPADLCFERLVEPLDRNQMLEAMRTALGIPEARIEIVETSQFSAPRGTMEFRREWLHAPALSSARTPVEWRGNVIYGENHRFTIWARVIVSAPSTRVVAAENLKSGQLITADKLRLESVDGFPLAADIARTVEEVAGRTSWSSISQGSEIHTGQLQIPPDISRGDSVEVEVRSGAARLAFTAIAEAAGRKGDVIAMRNPSSSKVFRARVDGKGRAFLDAGAPLGK